MFKKHVIASIDNEFSHRLSIINYKIKRLTISVN